jgi:hypothetical protein
MDLFHKVRVLVGALAHKPFTSHPETTEREEPAQPSPATATRRDVPKLGEKGPQGIDTDRVSDLITQRKKDKAS